MILGLIHFNWVIGGEFGFAESLPTNEKGVRVLNPKKIESFIVGLGLTVFGIFYLQRSGFISINMPNAITVYGGWFIPSIFIIRAIGDFNYIGFFKRIKQTNFGKLDSKFFSPLCLLIGVLGLITQVMR